MVGNNHNHQEFPDKASLSDDDTHSYTIAWPPLLPATRERAEMNEAITEVGRLVNRNTKAMRVSSLLLRCFSALLTTNLRIF